LTSLFEIRWERLAAVLLASEEVGKEVGAGSDIVSVLRKVAESDKGWVGSSALVLLVNPRVREEILEDLRRGLRPSSRLVSEAVDTLRAVLNGCGPGNSC